MIMILVVLTAAIFSQNTNPVVSNVSMSINGTTVTVSYDVSDTVTIGMKVSTDNGVTWDFNYGTASGDIGSGVSTGTDKQITWTYSGGLQDFIVMITANDEQVGGDNCGTVTYEGKTYNTIMIGDQCWLKENLNVGTRIAGNTNQTNNSTIEKYCYDNLETNCDTYGGLYQWNEAMQYSTTAGTKGICPEGWHIPTLAELQKLDALVNKNSNTLKAVGQGTGAGVGTNTSGFSALLAGYRSNTGNFSSLGGSTYFWSSTEFSSSNAYYMHLSSNNSNVGLYNINKAYGFSVRCVQD